MGRRNPADTALWPDLVVLTIQSRDAGLEDRIADPRQDTPDALPDSLPDTATKPAIQPQPGTESADNGNLPLFLLNAVVCRT